MILSSGKKKKNKKTWIKDAEIFWKNVFKNWNTEYTVHRLREETKTMFIGGRESYIYFLRVLDGGCKDVLLNKGNTAKLAFHVGTIDYTILGFTTDVQFCEAILPENGWVCYMGKNTDGLIL